MQVPIKTSPARRPPNPQAAFPSRDTGPPHDETGQARQRRDDASDAIPESSVETQQQVIVQFDDPIKHAFALRESVAQILTRVGIEIPFLLLARFVCGLERHLYYR